MLQCIEKCFLFHAVWKWEVNWQHLMVNIGNIVEFCLCCMLVVNYICILVVNYNHIIIGGDGALFLIVWTNFQYFSFSWELECALELQCFQLTFCKLRNKSFRDHSLHFMLLHSLTFVYSILVCKKYCALHSFSHYTLCLYSLDIILKINK